MDGFIEGLADTVEFFGDIVVGIGELIHGLVCDKDITEHPDYIHPYTPHYESYWIDDPIISVSIFDTWFKQWDGKAVRSDNYNPDHLNVDLSSDKLIVFYKNLYNYMRFGLNDNMFGKYESLYYAADTYTSNHVESKKLQDEMAKQVKDAGLSDRFLYILSYTNEDGTLATLRDNKEVLDWCANRIMDWCKRNMEIEMEIAKARRESWT